MNPKIKFRPEDFIMARNDRPASISVTGSFDEVLSVLRVLPKTLPIVLKIGFNVTNPESGYLEKYELPVMSMDGGEMAKKTLNGLYNQSRLNQAEYDIAKDRLEKIRNLMNIKVMVSLKDNPNINEL